MVHRIVGGHSSGGWFWAVMVAVGR
jgi:hypothetical protein